MKILIDMDGILVDLHTKWLRVYNDTYGDSLRLEDITTWDWREHTRPGSDLHGIINRLGFFDDLPPLPGAIAGFDAIRSAGYDVIVASAPACADSARSKIDWCRRHLGLSHRDVTLTHHKSWFAGVCDIIIDDKPQTLKEWSAYGKDAYTIAYPYNQGSESYCKFTARDYLDTERAWAQIVKELVK